MAKCKNCGAEVLDGALFCTECGEALENPFESDVKPSTNPFAEFENNVPKPESASTLVFDDPDWKKAEKIDAQAEAAQAVADEAAKQASQVADEAAKQASQERPSVAEAFAAGAAGTVGTASSSTSASANDDTNWHGQSNYGKPQYDPNARPEPQPEPQTYQASYGGPTYTYDEPQQGGWGSSSQQSSQQASWSAADEKAQQSGWGANSQQNQQANWNPTQQSIYADDYQDMPQGSDKAWAIASYFWVILWLLAFFLGRRDANGRRSNFLTHHLNQSFVLNVASIIVGAITRITSAAGILNLIIFVLAIMGIVYAAKGSTKPLPIVGDLKVFR